MGWQPLRVTTVPRGSAPATPSREAFLRLAMTHAAVMAGDAMVTVALAGSIFFSTSVSGARGRVLLSLLLTMAPFAVVAPLLGPAIDKSKGGRRLMVIFAAIGRCLTCIYMASVVHDLLLFLPSALVLLILSKAHAVAKSSLVPATVDDPEDLVQAGGRLAVLSAAAGFVAAGVGAAVLKIFDGAAVLRVAAVVYGVGAVLALRTKPAPPVVPGKPADHVDERARSRGVTLASVAMAGLRGMSGFLTFAIAFSFRSTHAPTWWYGVVVGAGVAGNFLGNLIGPRLREVIAEERILMLAMGVVAAIGLLAAYLNGRSAIALLALAVGMANGFGRLAFDAIVQRDGAEGSRARSFARFEATFQLTWVAAAVIPVAITIAGWVSALMIGVAAVGVLGYYVVARLMVGHGGAVASAVGVGPPPADHGDMVSGGDSDVVSDGTMMEAVREPAPAAGVPVPSGPSVTSGPPGSSVTSVTWGSQVGPRRNPNRTQRPPS